MKEDIFCLVKDPLVFQGLLRVMACTDELPATERLRFLLNCSAAGNSRVG